MARPPKYQCNVKYFNSVLSESQAYVLGFIWADGHVDVKSGLRIMIKTEDEAILQFIRSELSSNAPIKVRVRAGRNYSDFSVNRLELVNNLYELGIKSNKSQNNCGVPHIPDAFLPSFLRGLFDGDGSIWKTGENCWKASFTGGYNFLNWIKDYLLINNISTNPIRFRYKGNLNSCMMDITSKKNILNLKRLLYTTDGFCLKRKRERFPND